MGEHSAHPAVQTGDHGSRLQPAHGGQLHRQVGAKVPALHVTHTWENRLLAYVWVIVLYVLCSRERKTLSSCGGLSLCLC